jgi:outer membrane phospholipase A
MSLRLGVQHESNGQADPDSRSLNDLYAQSSLTWSFADRRFFRLTPRVWAYLGDLSDNPQIRETRGNWSCQAASGWIDDFQAAVDLRPGRGGAYPLITADLTLPLHRISDGNFPIFLHVQAVAGYGETLRDYDRYDAAVRIGISVVR